jgi:purine nucleoside phosphorylase
MIDLSFKYREAITYLKKESPFTPEIAVILGSGLGNFADSTNKINLFQFRIPGCPSVS